MDFTKESMVATASPTDAPLPSPLERRVVGAFVRATMFRRRKGSAWPVPPDLRHDEVRFAGNSGADLAGRFFPRDGAKGVVVLCHPDRRYGQHWFVRDGWVAWLLGHGYAVLTFDFANYGASRGGSTYLFEDAAAACRKARALAPGVPVHAIGLSIGAFSLANASPDLDVEALVLESPYPSFNSWYDGDGHRVGKAAMAAFDRLFPRTARLIQADRRIAKAAARRILIAASRGDTTTRIGLSRRVMATAPPERTRLLEVDGVEHLGLFRDSAAYREAILDVLKG
jgi:pimeloyl-ACP methyl ester carboxylesterase